MLINSGPEVPTPRLIPLTQFLGKFYFREHLWLSVFRGTFSAQDSEESNFIYSQVFSAVALGATAYYYIINDDIKITLNSKITKNTIERSKSILTLIRDLKSTLDFSCKLVMQIVKKKIVYVN